MMSPRKWNSLPPKTRLRKLVLLLHNAELELSRGGSPDLTFFGSLTDTRTEGDQLLTQLSTQVDLLRQAITDRGSHSQLLRGINALRHAVLRVLNAEPAEWDFLNHENGGLARNKKQIQPFVVYLEDIRSPFNVGAAFRTAEAFGVSRIYLSPQTPLPTHKKALRTARGCDAIVPWEVADLSVLGQEQDVFALETGGTPISHFTFPSRGTVLVGSEELGLSPEALKLADSKAGRVTVPMAGAKRSLNVSVAFGILMWAWYYSTNVTPFHERKEK